MAGPGPAGRAALDAVAAPYLAGADHEAVAAPAARELASGIPVCLAGTPSPDDVEPLLALAGRLVRGAGHGPAPEAPVAVLLRMAPHDDPDRGCLALARLPRLLAEADARGVAVRLTSDLGHAEAVVAAVARAQADGVSATPPAVTVDCRLPDAVTLAADVAALGVPVRLAPAELAPWARPRELTTGGGDSWRAGLAATLGRTHARAHAVDLAFVRAVKAVAAARGPAGPVPAVLATGDARLVDLLAALEVASARPPALDEVEVPWRGAPAVLARRLEHGDPVRVWLPFGHGWTIALARLALASPRATVVRSVGDRAAQRAAGGVPSA
ncbi:MAG: hypothetical protein U0Q15_05965 [Kineosporiaceae bacterium]